METLSWLFELQDRMSGPANRMSKGLSGLRAGLDSLSKTLKGNDDKALEAAGTWTRLVGSFNGGIGAAGGLIASLAPIASVLAVISAAAFGAIAAVGGIEVAFLKGGAALAEFGLEQVQFKENALLSLKFAAGSDAGAEKMFRRGVGVAEVTPFETKPVISALQKLQVGGLNSQSAEGLYALAADFSTFAGTGSSGLGGLTTLFTQMRGRGKIDQRHLDEIMNAGGAAAGLDTQGVLGQVMKSQNLGSTDQARAVLEKQGGADIGLQAIFDLYQQKLREKYDPNALVGQVSVDSGTKTISGLYTTLKSRFADLFLTLDGLQNLPGVEAFKGALRNITSLLGTTSETGKGLQSVVTSIFSDELLSTFKSFSGPEGLEKMQELLREAGVAIDHLGDGLQIAIGFGKGMASGIAEGLGLGKDLFDGPFDKTKVAELVRQFENVGHFIGEAIAKLAKLLGLAARFADSTGIGTAFDPNASTLDRLGGGVGALHALYDPTAAVGSFLGSELGGGGQTESDLGGQYFQPVKSQVPNRIEPASATQNNTISVTVNAPTGLSAQEVGDATAAAIGPQIPLILDQGDANYSG